MSTPAPELKEWTWFDRGEDEYGIHYRLSLGRNAFAIVYRNGDIALTVANGDKANRLRALIDEAERVGRHYWGEEWGKP